MSLRCRCFKGNTLKPRRWWPSPMQSMTSPSLQTWGDLSTCLPSPPKMSESLNSFPWGQFLFIFFLSSLSHMLTRGSPERTSSVMAVPATVGTLCYCSDASTRLGGSLQRHRKASRLLIGQPRWKIAPAWLLSALQCRAKCREQQDELCRSRNISRACVKEASAEFSVSGLHGNYSSSPSRKESTSTGSTKFEVQIVAQFDNHNSQVWRVSWNITSTLLASSGDDGCVRLWKGAVPSLACSGYSLACVLKGGGRMSADAVWVSVLSQPTTWTTGSARASWRATAARSAAHRVSPQPWAPSWAPRFTPLRTPWTGCQQEGRRCGASARHSPTP